MPRGRPIDSLMLDEDEKTRLRSCAQSRALPHSPVQRAQIILACAAGAAIGNHATHKHAKTKAWLARRPRDHIHYTPTYAAWLNQIERWFGLITQFVEHHNARTRSFVWTATAESIPARFRRLYSLNFRDGTLGSEMWFACRKHMRTQGRG